MINGSTAHRRARPKRIRPIVRHDALLQSVDREEIAFQANILAQVSDAVVAVNDAGRITYLNPAAERLYGLRADDVLGHPVSSAYTVCCENAPDQASVEAAIAATGSWQGESVRLTRDGRKIIGEASTCVLRDRHGARIGLLDTIRDIGERKRAEAQHAAALQAISESEARYRQMFGDSQAAQWLVDAPSGLIIDANAAAARFYGFTVEQMRRMRISDFNVLPPDQLAARLELAGRQAVHFEASHRLASGELRHVDVYSGPLDIGGHRLLYSIIHDISQRKLAEAAVFQRTQQLEALRKIDQAALAARSISEIGQTAVCHTRQAIPCRRVTLVRLDPAACEVVVLAEDADPATVAGAGRRIPLIRFSPRISAGTQAGVIVPDLLALQEHSPDERDLLAEGMRSYVAVPLVAAGRVLGWLALADDKPNSFGADSLDFARQIAASLVIALQNAELDEQLRAAGTQLRSLSRRLVVAQEAERRYVARELQDNADQQLAALKIGLGLLERTLDCSDDTRRQVEDLKQAADKVIQDLHDLGVEMWPATLEHLGLEAAVSQYVAYFKRRTGLNVNLVIPGLAGNRLDVDVKTAIYRAVQEALTNTLQHARASTAGVLITRDERGVTVVIEDDGIGFDPTAALRNSQLGLFGMRERIDMVGGTLTIESAPGKGTALFLHIPL